MSYCKICLGDGVVASLHMPWNRFIELAAPIRIGTTSHDQATQDLLKKVRQVPCPECQAPKIDPPKSIKIEAPIAETTKESNEDNRKSGQ